MVVGGMETEVTYAWLNEGIICIWGNLWIETMKKNELNNTKKRLIMG